MATSRSGWSGRRGAAARDRTRQAILDTALRLFSERGYIGVRVEDIAREAGLSRATFYKHFAERDEILAGLFQTLLGNVGELSVPPAGDPETGVRLLLGAAAGRMLEDELLARFVYSLPVRHDAVLPGGAAVPVVFDKVREALEAGVASGAIRPEISLDRAMEMLGRAFESAMRDWAESHVDDPRTRLDEITHLLFVGLQSDRLP